MPLAPCVLFIFVTCCLYLSLSVILIALPSLVTEVKSLKQSCSFTYLGRVLLPSIIQDCTASNASCGGAYDLEYSPLVENHCPLALATILSTVALLSPLISVKLANNEASANLPAFPLCSLDTIRAIPFFCVSFKAYLGKVAVDSPDPPVPPPERLCPP